LAKQQQSRSRRGRTRPAALNLTELKRSLKEFEDADGSDLELVERAMQRNLDALRRSTAKRLEAAVTDAVDVQRAKAILADHEAKQTKVLERNRTAAGKAKSAMDKKRTLGAASRRRALEALANPRLPFTPPSVVVEPILIWTKSDFAHSNTLVESHADPIGVSWAQVELKNVTSLPPQGENRFRVQFWYLWQNERDYYEVVNPSAWLYLDGNCTVRANTGVFDGGKSSVSCQATLNPMQWWESPTVPDSVQPSRWWNVFSVEADAGGFLSAGDIDGVTLSSSSRELRYDLFVIPPGAAAVILVEVSFSCRLDDGSIDIDFASTPAGAFPRSIQCQLQLELLTAPGLTGPVTLGNPVVSG
jgi:hypothetical protein